MIIDLLRKKRYYILCTIDENNIIVKATTYLLFNNVRRVFSQHLSLISN